MRMLNFLALSMLTLSVGLAADHPIIISNGSPLTIEHNSWKPIDDNHLGSSVTDTVTRVVIASNASPKPRRFDFNQEKLTLTLTYGTVNLTVTANDDDNRQGIVVTTNKSFGHDFQRNGNQYVRDEPGAAIAKVSVKQGNAPLATIDVTEPTKITICYGTPTGNSVTECK